MRQLSSLRKIFKLHSSFLKENNYDLCLPAYEAMEKYPDSIVSISSSQILRFIDSICGYEDRDAGIKRLNSKIRMVGKQKDEPKSRKEKSLLYKRLLDLQFISEYVCIIMDNMRDYDYLNEHGFYINGTKFRRLLGTNGGIKNSTIVYIAEKLYPELKSRIDNGRDMDMKLVPAKLEAYQALVCSGSTPIPSPNGIIVVKDCITKFKEDVIVIDDSVDGEPDLREQKDYEVEHNDSDGYGLMLPGYSKRVNEYLGGKEDEILSGMNTRYAWTKGMVYTFDFIEFAEKVAGTYEIVDVWGHKRDVRNAEVILTESMLKLWEGYDSWESYYENCQKNGYVFSTPKVTPDKLENIRNMNYQFLQSYNFTDEEIEELCRPTIDEIKGCLGLDYRKSLIYLAGDGLKGESVLNKNIDPVIRALMIEPDLINDSYVRKRIRRMIQKRIDDAKKGCIKVNGNYAMISGDPYALCQSMFGLEITGLLGKGEVYHKYWIDKGANEIVCFRAPMTCHNNIRKMRLNKDAVCAHWYQYINSALIYNAWDTACDAMNGADKDGDTNMTTDNPVLLRETQNSKTIMCLQKKAEKKIPTEEDIIKANKLAFNDDIGTVTNRVTSMFERQAEYDKESEQYKILAYRIMCGQSYQQATIDRAKGIIAKSMPESWYSRRACKKEGGDIDLVAERKPYFMIYVYPTLKKEYANYMASCDRAAIRRFGHLGIESAKDLWEIKEPIDDVVEFLNYYYHLMPVGLKKCTVNKICWKIENELGGREVRRSKWGKFDSTILKSATNYKQSVKSGVLTVLKDYEEFKAEFAIRARYERIDRYDNWVDPNSKKQYYQDSLSAICNNDDELCNALVDVCYCKDTSKGLVWDLYGDLIVNRLLQRSNNTIHYPIEAEEMVDFEYNGKGYKMETAVVDIDSNE